MLQFITPEEIEGIRKLGNGMNDSISKFFHSQFFLIIFICISFVISWVNIISYFLHLDPIFDFLWIGIPFLLFISSIFYKNDTSFFITQTIFIFSFLLFFHSFFNHLEFHLFASIDDKLLCSCCTICRVQGAANAILFTLITIRAINHPIITQSYTWTRKHSILAFLFAAFVYLLEQIGHLKIF